jgi:hypothetical protein
MGGGPGGPGLPGGPGGPGGPMGPGGPGGMGPGGPGGMGPGGPGGMGPGGGGDAGLGQDQAKGSTVGLTREGGLLLLAADVIWNEKLRGEITSALREGVAIARATTDMAGDRPRVHQLAAALHMYTEKHRAFPQGAYNRPSNAQRFSRPWPPDQRVSWMADVLRYLPQYIDEYGNTPGSYPLGIKTSLSWNDKDNLRAARMLVPQFMGMKVPETEWRVRYPKIALPVAATHFVGLAGIGLDAAEEGTAANRRGVFSYDHRTNLAEITDGPQNTVAVVQVPADFKTPWLAGGGSTVRGVPEKDSIRPFVCTEYQGKRGTFGIMANGDVRFIHHDIPDSLFQAMVTISGAEPVKKEDLDKYAPLVPSPEGMERELKAAPAATSRPPAPPTGAGAPAADAAKKSNDLKRIVLAYHSFLDKEKRPPTGVSELEPYYEKDAGITAAIKDGGYVVYWNVKILQLVNGTSNTVLAYEKDAPTKGGVVAFADGSVRPLTAEEFAKAAKPPGN